ncbi:neuropeptide CCHamide-1 receptor-like [Apostichopus japonicus]|uniref:neuropeptide CCHamide-1 receptor-like n=1 Tax=Stichopus japonicus TaxID=307972 RepID=UPI003AB7C6E2
MLVNNEWVIKMSESFNLSYEGLLASCDDQLASTKSLRNVYVTIFCLIVVAAVLANGTVLYIIYIRQLWRDVSVVMIGNLAISDIFVCVGVLVPEISKWIGYWEGNIYTSRHVCRIHVVAETLFPTVTIFSLVVMSFERCRISRSKVLRNRQPHRKSICYFTLALVWILALSSSLPVIKICQSFHDQFYYAEDWGKFMNIFVIFRFILIYLLPLLLIACFYTIMATTLYKSLRTTRELASQIRINTAGKRAQERRRRLAIMVFLLVVVFAIGWLPFYVFRFLFYNPEFFCSNIVLGHLKNFRLIFFCLLSLLNPCIVYVVGANFRRYLNDVFRCREDNGKDGYQTKKTTVTCNLGSNVVEENDSCIQQNGDVDV